MRQSKNFIISILALICISCSDGNDVPSPLPVEPETPVTPGQDGEIDYDKVGIEYDDGTNIIFHVKIAIDKEGWDMRDEEFFKTRLKTQWEGINERFNKLDKKGSLVRNYIFVPDLEDIILYNHDDNKEDPSSSHWEVPKHHNDRIDRNKFQCLVAYDFAVQEGEGGGGFGNGEEGLGNILVINPSKENIGKFYDHFSDKANTVAAITHEMGHFRGVVDTYLCRINGKNNPVNGEGFEPEKGNMNNPYPALDQCEWSEYEMRVINLNGAKKQQYIFYYCMHDWFPDMIEFNITQNGEPVEDCTLNIYKMTDYKVWPDAIKNYPFNGGTLRKKAKEIFWHNTAAWSYYNMVLVEAIDNKTGKKGYSFMPAYELHNKGIIDKYENKIEGRSIFKRTIEIKESI